MSSDHDDQKHGDPDEAWQVLGLVNDWLKHAEAKAGLALATAGVLGGLLYSLVGDWIGPPWWIVVPLLLSVGCILAAGLCGAVAVIPRLWRKEPATSKVYYDHIARAYPRATSKRPARLPEFEKDFARTTGSKSALFDELTAQVWVNAHIAATKYKWSTWAIVFVVAAAVAVALTAAGVAWESR